MIRKLTMNDIIEHYLIYYGSSFSNALALSPCPTMWEEMNEIKAHYQDLLFGKSSVYSVKDILRMCVRGLYSTGHQRRVEVRAIDEAVDSLMKDKWTIHSALNGTVLRGKNRFYDKFADFEELYHAIRQIIGGVNGIGFVTVYDTARRLGHLLNKPIYPCAYVYLHYNKVNSAAKAILGVGKLNYREPALIFLCPFGKLPSINIEDLLCTYSDIFVTINKSEDDADETVVRATANRWREMTLEDFLKLQEEKQKRQKPQSAGRNLPNIY